MLQKERNYAYDNLKAFLIVCVVFGHLLEIVSYQNFLDSHIKRFSYFLIYSFHMPAFLYLTGKFGKFSWSRSISFLCIYFVFQTIHGLVSYGKILNIQYHVPSWTLWYLLAMVYYNLTIPLLRAISPKYRWFVLAIAILASLAVGYFDKIGHAYTLSRYFVFLPFFVLGYYSQRRGINSSIGKKWIILLTGLCFLLATAALYLRGGISKQMLYGSYPYSELGYGACKRFVILIIAGLWILWLEFVFCVLIKNKIPYISTIGANTLPIYLMHSFACNIIEKYNLLGDSLLRVFIYTAVIVFAFGNAYIKSIFDALFFGKRKK